MVPFYLINRTRKRIELLFSLFTKEEFHYLNKKDLDEAKSSILEISEALIPKYFLNWKAKKVLERVIWELKVTERALQRAENKGYRIKKLLISNFFRFNRANSNLEESLNVICNVWKEFISKNTAWGQYSEQDLYLVLKTSLNKGYTPITSNKKAFEHQFRECLKNFKFTTINIIHLYFEISTKLFENYGKYVFSKSVKSKKVINGVLELFTSEEKEYLEQLPDENVVQNLFMFGEEFNPIHKSVEEAKQAIQSILPIIRKNNGIAFTDENGRMFLCYFLLDSLFYK